MSKNYECSYCKNKIKFEDKFCPSCGKKLNHSQENTHKQNRTHDSIVYCYNCGAPNQCGEKTCINCEISLHPWSKKSAIRHYRAGTAGKVAGTICVLIACLLQFYLVNTPSESELRSQELRKTLGLRESTSPSLAAILGTIFSAVCYYLVVCLIIEFVIWIISSFSKVEPPKYDIKELNKRKTLLDSNNSRKEVRKQQHETEICELDEANEDDL